MKLAPRCEIQLDDVPKSRRMLAAFEASDAPRPSFAIAHEDGLITLWDTSTACLARQLTRPTHLAVRWTSIAWQPAAAGSKSASGLLALGCDSGAVVVWDTKRAALVHELNAHTQRVGHVVFSSDGLLLYSCADDGQICCWETRTGEVQRTFKADKAMVQRLAMGANDATVLLGGSQLKLMRRDTWKRVWRLPGHATAVRCMCFSADERIVISAGGDDRHVCIWNTDQASADDGQPCLHTLSCESAVAELGLIEGNVSGGGEWGE